MKTKLTQEPVREVELLVLADLTGVEQVLIRALVRVPALAGTGHGAALVPVISAGGVIKTLLLVRVAVGVFSYGIVPVTLSDNLASRPGKLAILLSFCKNQIIKNVFNYAR